MEYVLIHTRLFKDGILQDKILVVHKKKPKFQAGKLNLLGGKVENGEHFLDASVRELKEESGLVVEKVKFCGMLKFSGGNIYCVSADVYEDFPLNPGPNEVEQVEWLAFDDAFSRENLMPNLRILVPLLHHNVTGWTVNYICDSHYKSLVEFENIKGE